MGWGVFAGSLATTGMKTYRDLEEDTRENERLKLAKNADSRAASAESRAQGTYDREARAAQDVRDAAGFKPGAINDGGSSAALETAAAPAAKGLPTPTAQPSAAAAASADPVTPRAALPAPAKVSSGASMSRLETARQAYETLRTPAALDLLREAEKDDTQRQQLAIQRQDSNVRMRVANQAMTHADYEHSRKRYTDTMKGAAGIAAQLEKIPDPKTSVLDPSARQTVRDLATQMVEASKFTPDGKSYGFEEIEGGLRLYEVDDKTGKRLNNDRVYSSVGDIREAFTAASALAEPGVMEQYGLASGLQRMMNDAPALRADYLKVQNIVKDRKNLADPVKKQEAIELAHQIALKDPSVEETVETPVRNEKGEVILDDSGKPKTVKTVQNKLIRQIEAASPRTQIQVISPETKLPVMQTLDQVADTWASKIPSVFPKFGYNQDVMKQAMIEDLVGMGWEPVAADWAADNAIAKADKAAGSNIPATVEQIKANAMSRSAIPYSGVAYDNVQ